MAAALLLLVIIDTSITGYLLSHCRQLTKRVAELDNAIDVQCKIIDDVARDADARRIDRCSDRPSAGDC